MTIIDTPKAMREWSLQQRANGKSVGCVPTMGALHEGHMSLVKASVETCDVTILTLFVNPAQFAPHEDFGKYPRTFDADCALCEAAGVDAVYAPKASSMYSEHYATYVEVHRLQEGLCGTNRPNYFRGVATVVTKLFNATLPDKAFFGLKDGQQFTLIKRMARDLDMGIDVIAMPTVRESDGLAMSSRNQHLSVEERERALCLSRSLFAAEDLMDKGERNAETILNTVRAGLKDVEIEYVTLVDGEEMTPVTTINGPVMLAVAVKLGATRLIDNIRFVPTSKDILSTPESIREGSMSH